MRRHYTTVTMLLLLLFWQGCVFVADSLDYRNDLSDYEVKRIVRTVFLSQHALADAALLTSDSYSTLTISGDGYQTDSYACNEGGEIRFQIDNGGYSFSFSTGDLLHLSYDACAWDSYYDAPIRLSGPVDLTWYQDMQDRESRLIELAIDYRHAMLKNGYTTLWLDGELGLHYDLDNLAGILKVVLSSTQLRIDNSDVYGEDTYENIVLDFTMDTRDYAYSYSYHGTLFNSRLGRLTFSTLAPMRGYRDANPYSGTFKITNAHVTLRVIPVDDYYVDIVVRNSYDSYQNRTIRTTWLNIGL